MHAHAASNVGIAHADDNAAASRHTGRIPPAVFESFDYSPVIAVTAIEEAGNTHQAISFDKARAGATGRNCVSGSIDHKASGDRVAV
jgi:hypothetical protein